MKGEDLLTPRYDSGAVPITCKEIAEVADVLRGIDQ